MHVYGCIGVYEKERRGDRILERRDRSRRRGNALGKGALHCDNDYIQINFSAFSGFAIRPINVRQIVGSACSFSRWPVIGRSCLWKPWFDGRKGSMRRDHVKQQWKTLRLPRNIHSVPWTLCLLAALGLYPVLADIILQDMGKCTTILFRLTVLL